MKHYILFVFISFFTISGCTFLGGSDDLTSEDLYGEEESFGEEESSAEEEEFEEEDEDEEYAEEDGEGDDEYAEKEEKGGLRGFFSRIFSSSDEETETEEEDSDFFGEDEGFAEGDRDYEDYEEEESDAEDYATAEDMEGEIVASVQEKMDSDATPTSSEEPVASAPTEPVPSVPAETQPSPTPLNKIISIPYRKAGYLVNAVYIARPGDNLENISQKIYSSNQLDILRQINPHLQSRAVKVGDKIYYNSPFRREDSSRLLFYYQDIEAPSSFHTLSPGDNIRQVASQLLGHPNSWKEIWAINPDLVSKGEITRSIDIVYWPESAAQARLSEPVPAPVEETAPMDGSPDSQEEIEPEQLFAEDTLPSPPVLEEKSQVRPKKGKLINILRAILKQKEMFAVLIGIIIILIFILRLILKKRKQRDFDYTATNIEV